MIARELAAADLDNDGLLELIHSDDPVGVLSIYVDGTCIATDRGAAIDIDNRLAELARAVTAAGSPLPSEALDATLRRIAPAPNASSRSRAVSATPRWAPDEAHSASPTCSRHSSTPKSST